MNKICYLFLLVVVFTISSCDLNRVEDEVLLRTDRFTNDSPDHVERWVFISDQNGNVLDVVKPDASSGVIEFRGEAGNYIMLTELRVISFDNGSETQIQNNITTYMGIPVGSSYFLYEEETNTSPYPDPVGKAKITLNNYEGSDEPWFSIGFSDGYSGYNSWLDYDTRTYDGSTFMADMNLREDPIDLFISSYNGTDPVYSWVRDASVGDSVVVDYETFSPMIPVTINKPVTNAYIQGKLEPGIGGRGYFLSWSEYWRYSNHFSEGEIITLGYTDDFPYYDVYAVSGQILCFQPHEGVSYHKLGTSVPQSIHLPDYTFSLNNEKLFNLNYSFDRQYSYKNFSFSEEQNNNAFRWVFYAPEGIEIKVPQIPVEILSQYPYLFRNNIPLQYVSFNEYLDGYTYQEYIKTRLENRSLNRPEFEQLRYYFQF